MWERYHATTAIVRRAGRNKRTRRTGFKTFSEVFLQHPAPQRGLKMPVQPGEWNPARLSVLLGSGSRLSGGSGSGGLGSLLGLVVRLVCLLHRLGGGHFSSSGCGGGSGCGRSSRSGGISGEGRNSGDGQQRGKQNRGDFGHDKNEFHSGRCRSDLGEQVDADARPETITNRIRHRLTRVAKKLRSSWQPPASGRSLPALACMAYCRLSRQECP